MAEVLRVSPLARFIIAMVARTSPADLVGMMATIESEMTSLRWPDNPRRYVIDLPDGGQAKIVLKGKSGRHIVGGEIRDRETSYDITDEIVAVKHLPAAIRTTLDERAGRGELRVCDIISFLPDDLRRLCDGYHDADRDKTWWQLSYTMPDDIDAWPTWEQVRESAA